MGKYELNAGLVILIFLVAIWSLYWKGRALWKAARNSQKGWFVALLVINTLGILEIIYIYSSLSNTSERIATNKPTG